MTIRHLVAWTINTDDAADRASKAAEITKRLKALEGVVPSIESLSAGAGLVEGNWDVAIVADFADLDALEAYNVHPAHQEVVTYVRSVVSARVAVDFEL